MLPRSSKSKFHQFHRNKKRLAIRTCVVLFPIIIVASLVWCHIAHVSRRSDARHVAYALEAIKLAAVDNLGNQKLQNTAAYLQSRSPENFMKNPVFIAEGDKSDIFAEADNPDVLKDIVASCFTGVKGVWKITPDSLNEENHFPVSDFFKDFFRNNASFLVNKNSVTFGTLLLSASADRYAYYNSAYGGAGTINHPVIVNAACFADLYERATIVRMHEDGAASDIHFENSSQIIQKAGRREHE